MSKDIFDEFDEMYDVEGLAEEVKEAAENGSGNYVEVPHGKYEVSVDKMELTKSKKGEPMVTIWFKVLAGDHKGNLIFFNQVVKQGFHFHKVNELLRGMDTGLDIKFESYKQYGTMLMDVFEAVNGHLEFALDYAEGKKGFSTYTITDVFDAA